MHEFHPILQRKKIRYLSKRQSSDFFAVLVFQNRGLTRVLQQTKARGDGFQCLDTLGADMEGSAMHQTLLAAHDKLFA
jgi:hypothetical protein